jgi:isopentenyl diphosphate isomerase/L-lactate dehydrogenase-like FMN-dependent dehydrogenase
MRALVVVAIIGVVLAIACMQAAESTNVRSLRKQVQQQKLSAPKLKKAVIVGPMDNPRAQKALKDLMSIVANEPQVAREIEVQPAEEDDDESSDDAKLLGPDDCAGLEPCKKKKKF